MEKRILVVGGDRRQRFLAQKLTTLGTVDTLGVPDCPDTAGEAPYDRVILPCPSCDKAGNIRGPAPLNPEQLLPLLGPETRCYGGGLAAGAGSLPGALGRATDLLADPVVAAANGRLTAEAACVLSLLHREDSLREQSCLVMGWGWIGRPLSLLLRDLCPRVTVGARRPEAAAQAMGLGLEAHLLADVPGGSTIVFNTIPAPVLTRKQLESLGSCLWMELASAPGGLPEVRPEAIRFLPAGGLPSRYLPKAAAEILYQGILRTERCVL